MILCPICNKNYNTRRVFALHLSTTHKDIFDNELLRETLVVNTLFGEDEVNRITTDYINEKYCIATLPIKISKFLELSGLKRTSKQERATSRYKTVYINGIQEKYGCDVTNPSQIKEVQLKKEKSYAKKYGSYEKYLEEHRSYMISGYTKYVGTDKHKETISKQQNACMTRYGHQNFGAGHEAKEKSKITLRETISTWDYEERLRRTSIARESVGYSSKPEKRIRHCLTELDIEFSSNIHLWHYNYDIVFGNFIIEVQGDFWHANPTKYKANDLIIGKVLASDLWEKDRKKKNKANENGFTLIAIWECEITNKSDEDLILLVESKLKDNGYEFYN